MTDRLVAAGDFLTLHYRLSGPDGAAIVDTFDQQPATLTLGVGELSPALESCLIGMNEGAQGCFELPADATFGAHNPELLQRVSRRMLDEHGDPDEVYAVGDVITFPSPTGEAHFAGRVAGVGDDWVLFDFNHPLAGVPLRFEVQVVGVLR
jgi:FKBP-type peptidyl-prolyl cis-trans isomerase SlpA